MIGLFKRRKPCAHNYLLSDYRSYVDIALEDVYKYEIACQKCGKKREVSQMTYAEMKRLGLIIEREGV